MTSRLRTGKCQPSLQCKASIIIKDGSCLLFCCLCMLCKLHPALHCKTYRRHIPSRCHILFYKCKSHSLRQRILLQFFVIIQKIKIRSYILLYDDDKKILVPNLMLEYVLYYCINLKSDVYNRTDRITIVPFPRRLRKM